MSARIADTVSMAAARTARVHSDVPVMQDMNSPPTRALVLVRYAKSYGCTVFVRCTNIDYTSVVSWLVGWLVGWLVDLLLCLFIPSSVSVFNNL